jgi:hypothetical protein
MAVGPAQKVRAVGTWSATGMIAALEAQCAAQAAADMHIP